MNETEAPQRLFGTDGIRAPFGAPPLDRATVSALGAHLARMLVEGATDGEPPGVVMGGDTRSSTPTITRWLARGLAAGGARVRHAGVIPTPAVAFLARKLGAACAVAVSASHNLPPDNGIKLVTGDGFKWTPEAEKALEDRLRAEPAPPIGGSEPAIDPEPELTELYLASLLESLPGDRPLGGLRLAVDAAHGAASACAGRLFTALGAQVHLLAASPDGENINLGCGSTHPEALAAVMVGGGFDLGIAFDGDADRALFVDETGGVRDGDLTLYLWARDLAARGQLPGSRIVATSMSNLGLERALARDGIGVERCDVGDREVVAMLLRQGLRLGGEQSGHIVDLARATTGDGLATALAIASLLRRSGRPFSHLAGDFRRHPQILLNVPVREKVPFEKLPAVCAAAARIEERLGTDGRLVLRYSGTEPLARIMIEGPEQEAIEDMAREIAAEITAEITAAVGWS